ncbi:RNA polymerase sigma factor SigF, partial [Streptomyces sp. NPDC006393]
MAVTTEAKATPAGTELPEVADPSQIAPSDARALSRLFFDRLATL